MESRTVTVRDFVASADASLTQHQISYIISKMASQHAYSNVVETVAAQLRADILVGRLAPGARLRQDAIAADYGVSHIPVREALRQLEAEGLVAIRPRHGAAVASLSASEIDELYEIRIALEPCVIRAVIENASSAELKNTEAILDEIDRNPDRWVELNTAFHLALYRAARRPRLLATIEPILRSCERYLHHEVKVLDNFTVSQREHRELLRAIMSRDAKKACAILRRHIEHPRAENIRTLRALGLE